MPIARQARDGVLILGGFAGGYVARLLGTGSTVVSLENYMLYTPLLPEAASGTLEPRHVVVPLRQMCRKAELGLPVAKKGRIVVDETLRVERREQVWALGQVATLGHYKLIADVLGLHLRGFLGWFVTRTYHLYQLPLLTRKLRVVVDWTVALFFRRDIAELGGLGEPRGLRDG
jgi:NADH dehydrogenase FAD-containing subunit